MVHRAACLLLMPLTHTRALISFRSFSNSCLLASHHFPGPPLSLLSLSFVFIAFRFLPIISLARHFISYDSERAFAE